MGMAMGMAMDMRMRASPFLEGVLAATVLFKRTTGFTNRISYVFGCVRPVCACAMRACVRACSYHVLGVSERASDKEISKAWKQYAKKWHPDRNKEEGADDMFMKGSSAYETLSDETKRREYDHYGEGGPQQHGHHGGHRQGFHRHPFFNQFHQQQRHTPYENQEDHFSMRQLLNLADGTDCQPTLIQFMHSHYRYVQPDVWHQITKSLRDLGIRSGVADVSKNRYLFNDMSVNQFEIRGYYRGRVVRGPYLDNRISPRLIAEFAAEWLSGGTYTAQMFGPNANVTVVQNVVDIPSFIRDTDPWRPKALYIASHESGAHGSPVIGALALKYGAVCDFGVLYAYRPRDRAFQLQFRDFALKHGVVGAPALVFFWPHKEGRSSGTLNEHSLSLEHINRVLVKVVQQYQKHHADQGPVPLDQHRDREWGGGDTAYRIVSSVYLFLGTSITGATIETVIVAIVALFALIVNLQLMYMKSLQDSQPRQKSNPNHNREERRKREMQLRADEQRLTQLLRFVPASDISPTNASLSCPRRCGHDVLEKDPAIAITILNGNNDMINTITCGK